MKERYDEDEKWWKWNFGANEIVMIAKTEALSGQGEMEASIGILYNIAYFLNFAVRCARSATFVSATFITLIFEPSLAQARFAWWLFSKSPLTAAAGAMARGFLGCILAWAGKGNSGVVSCRLDLENHTRLEIRCNMKKFLPVFDF